MRNRRIQVCYRSSGLIVTLPAKYANTLLQRGVCYLVTTKPGFRGRGNIYK